MEKFDGKGDYMLWKEKLLAHLEMMGLLEGLEEEVTSEGGDSTAGEETPSAEVTTPAASTTEKSLKEKRGKARSTIILSVGDNVLRKIIKEKSAAGMIKVLDHLFMAKSLPNRIYLKQRLYSYKMSDGMTLDENINDFLRLIADLEHVKVMVSDEDQAIILLMALPKQFDQLKDTLKYGKTSLSLDEIVGAVRSKELELGATGKLTRQSSEGLFVQDRGRSERRDRASDKGKHKNRSKSKGKKTCWVCGKDGHYKKQCFIWKERNKQQRDSSSERGESSNVTGQITDAAALMVSESLLSLGEEFNKIWIMDTGCSFHMTPRRDWFITLDETCTGKVRMANDTYSEVRGVGSIRIKNEDNSTVLLTNVRYVPGMSKNLISLGTLEDQGCWFQSRDGVMKINRGCRTLIKGQKTDTLYVLQGSVLTGSVNAAVGPRDETRLWHRRLGHMSQKGMKALVKKGYLDSAKVTDMDFCEDCIYGKAHRVSFGVGKHVTKGKLDYIHSDLWGSPNVPLSLGKCQYFISFIDDYSRKTWIYFLRKKDEAFASFLEWKKMAENQSGRKIKTLRTDNGLEFCNMEFNNLCKEEGIVRHKTCAYTPQQNGVAERMNRTILDKVRSVLSESGLPKSFWAEAAAIAVHQINISPSSAVDFEIPEEIWTGSRPKYEELRVFGSVAYIHSDQGKLNPRAKKAVFIGYPSGVKGYKFWLVEEKKCVVTRDVTFQEDKMYKHLNQSAEPRPESQRTEIPLIYEINHGDFSDLGGAEMETERDQEADNNTEDKEQAESSEDEEYQGNNHLENYQLARDRERRVTKKPSRFEESNMVGFALMVTEDGGFPEPSCFGEAMRDKDWRLWKEAMDEEMQSLHKNQTWTLIERPENCKVIGCKWVYKRKAGIPGVEQPRFKARLVAKGYLQKEGIDYEEIFSPVVKHVSIRLMLSYVVNLDLELEQLDVKTAFLHGNLDEYILMEQPEGYQVKTGADEEVCHLKKSLYGLKQAPRQWNQRFNTFMKNSGYQRSNYDSCIYFQKLEDGSYIYLLLYVDDMLIAAKKKEKIQELKSLLSKEFEMKDLGEAKKILGMEIKRDRVKGTLEISQGDYLKKVLHTFRMEQCKGVQTPLGIHFKLRAAEEEELAAQADYMKTIPYSNAVGSIMYSMIGTRPDLAYPLCVVSRYMSKPLKEHWLAVKWVLRYIKATQDLKLVYRKQDSLEIRGYCDSDYAADPDRRRSITGFVFTAGGNVISWKSGLQRVVALSTTEAEYMALTESIKEAVWLKGLAAELGFVQEHVEVMCDSQSAISLAKNSVHHDRTKHIDVRLHFIRDKIADGEIKVSKVSTLWNPADIFTKTVPVSKLQEALELLRISSH